MNTADFLIDTSDDYEIFVICPECGLNITPDMGLSNIPDIRTLITTASTHARKTHPMSAPAVIQGA